MIATLDNSQEVKSDPLHATQMIHTVYALNYIYCTRDDLLSRNMSLTSIHPSSVKSSNNVMNAYNTLLKGKSRA